MIEALALVFAGYAGFAAWPWWTATLVGALSGFQVANARMYKGTNKDRVASGDPAMSRRLFQASLIGISAGSALATAAYFVVRLLIR